MESSALVKPRLRGVSHQFASFAALCAGLLLVAAAPRGAASQACIIYSAAMVMLFGVSALYHRATWAPRPRMWMRRLDHACIFVFIAGTYTPVCMMALPPAVGNPLLLAVWGGAGLGVAQSLFWVRAPRAVALGLYLLLGWTVAPFVGDIYHGMGTTAASLIALGGLLYTVGAIIYGLRRPDPFPKVFGYHEIFHALVILACICHFVAVFLMTQAHMGS